MTENSNTSYVITEEGEYIFDEAGNILAQTEDGDYIYIPVCEQNEVKNSNTDLEDAINEESVKEERLWTDSNTILLINLYKKHESKFDRQIKKFVWQKIADEIHQTTSFKYTPTQVDTKWKRLVRSYKDIIIHNRTTGKNRKDWKFFDLMHEILYQRPEVTPVATCSSSGGLKVNKEKTVDRGDTAAESKFESLFMKKRRCQDSGIEKRHRDKMQRLDKLQGTLDRMVDLLSKTPQTE